MAFIAMEAANHDDDETWSYMPKDEPAFMAWDCGEGEMWNVFVGNGEGGRGGVEAVYEAAEATAANYCDAWWWARGEGWG